MEKGAFGKGPLNVHGNGAEVNAGAIGIENYILKKRLVRPCFKLVVLVDEVRHHTQKINQRKLVTHWKEIVLDDCTTF